MNQFDNYLSGLSVGEHVRITQTNGQVLEGVIVQNDGTESFQLQVTMKMFRCRLGIFIDGALTHVNPKLSVGHAEPVQTWFRSAPRRDVVKRFQ